MDSFAISPSLRGKRRMTSRPIGWLVILYGVRQSGYKPGFVGSWVSPIAMD